MKPALLNEICHKITDGSHNPPKGQETGDLMLSSRNITDEGLNLDSPRYINRADFELENKRTDVTPGDLLMTIVGTVGRVLVVEEHFPKFTLQRSVGVLKPNIEVVFPKYLAYALRAPAFQRKLVEGSKGVAQKGIYLNDIRKLEIPLPPLEEQKKIAAILDAADALRQKDKGLIAKYEELTQSLFLDMFGNPETNPKGWELKSFEYFAKFDTRMTKDFEKYAKYPHIGIANIEKETGRLIDYKLVEEDSLISGKYIFGPDHIIYSKIRPNLNKVALPNFTGLCSADSYPLLIKKENTNRIFLAFLLRSNAFVDFILGHSTRTNIPKANKAQMKLFKGYAPPVHLQNKFAERVRQIEKQKQLAQQSLQKSEELFNSLLQRAFKGELTKTLEPA